MLNCSFHPSGGDCIRCQKELQIRLPLKVAEDTVWVWNKLKHTLDIPEVLIKDLNESVRKVQQELLNFKE